ncbi:MAG: bifunctional hydroxymethylpyrimidine kinase/phosphomethylpyrimidine kinase, partial [Prevotella sp.]|nr:bifunctional hydroxymethylpyrimidine kinase/phosphomethylpyrimidine kinase [Prevotella sp.]
FYDAEQDELTLLPSVRVHTRNTHGTGCTMSSAFATLLAQGNTLQQSAKGAKEYISQAIIAGADYDIGKGHGPVNHFFR